MQRVVHIETVAPPMVRGESGDEARTGTLSLLLQDEDYFPLPVDVGGAVQSESGRESCYGFRTAKTTFITALDHVLGDLPEPPMMHRFL